MQRKPQPAWEIYKKQMDSRCFGDALWEPSPIPTSYSYINIGDVGYIRNGRFHLLFSAARPLGDRKEGIDVPIGFEELTISPPVFSLPREPSCIRTEAVQRIGAGLGVTASTIIPLEPGAHFSFELTGTRGAALVTGHETYRGDASSDPENFKEYTKRHYESWVALARIKMSGDVRPILVDGFDMTKDFAMVAYSNGSTSLEGGLTIEVPMFASASASIRGTWRASCSPHTNYGPQECVPPHLRTIYPPSQPIDEGSVPGGYNQCVFVRYYTMRWRKWILPKVIRGAAGPHDLGSADNRGDVLPELMARTGVESRTSDDEDLEGQWDPTTEDTDSEPSVVVHNTSYDKEYDDWDAIADYVFQNSDAASVLMHHRDLAWLRMAGGADSVSELLAKHKPRIVVDESGVGRITYEGIQRKALTPLSTSAPTSDAHTKVEHPVRRLDSPEPSVSGPVVTTHETGLSNITEEDPNVMESATLVAPADSGGATTVSAAQSAFQRLVSRIFNPDELPSLIEAASSEDQAKVIYPPSKDAAQTFIDITDERSLSKDAAQTLIDVIDEVLETIDPSPETLKKCLRALYKTCSRNRLIPSSLRISLDYNPGSLPLYHGASANVWRGKNGDRDVAVKVVRTYVTSDLQRVAERFCRELVAWKYLRHPNVVPLIGAVMDGPQLLFVSDWMSNGNINVFVRTHPDADRLELLRDVAKGLIYIHSQEVIHGDLKGSKILIDETGHARLAGFYLATIAWNTTDDSSPDSPIQGGTARWMSPELLYSRNFGFEEARRTKSSDCYALGMVIYEIISGHLPFHMDGGLTIITKVSEGERPPRVASFTDSLWNMLERCWEAQPDARPSIEDVLQCLEQEEALPPRPDVKNEWDPSDDSSSDDSLSDDSFYSCADTEILFVDPQASGSS